MPDFNSNLTSSYLNPPYQLVAPSTGGSVTVNNGVAALVINPAGSLLTLTVMLPNAPKDGQVLSLASTQLITGLTLTPSGGQSVVGSISTLVLGGFASYRWVSSLSTWVRTG
jgi:hypothetical protein